MKLLYFAEKPEQLIDGIAFAKHIGSNEVYGVVVGKTEGKNYEGYNKIYEIIAEKILPDAIAAALKKLYETIKPDLVVGPATKNGNDVISRIAALTGIPMITEAIDATTKDDKVVLTRQVLAGRATTTYEAKPPIAITIPLKKFTLDTEPPTTTATEEIRIEEPSKLVITDIKEKAREAVNSEEAEIVVGVGRGFKKKEDLKLAEELAELLGGVVGCTRPIAADYGWLSEDRWIGISGKKIKPKLYLAIGISGAPQHMSAVMDSKVIVAINKDKAAPIFQYADYGVVADLYKFVPILIKKIRERLGK